jgi:hypothetical protein
LSVRVEFGFAPSSEPVAYNDITDDVISVSVNRGKDPEAETFNAASCSVQLNNQTRNYDPDYGPSPYQGLIVPTGSLRIYSNDQIVFTGLITDWNFTYSPSGDSVAEIVATDAFWNLSNQVLTEFFPGQNLSSARINSVLARPELGGTAAWPTTMKRISTGVATLGDYDVPEGTNALSYLQQIEKAESGRLFIDKEGRLVFRSRNNDFTNAPYQYTRTNLSANPSFEVNVRNWVVGGGGTLAKSTAQAYIGTASGLLTPASGPDGARGVGADQYFTSKPFADYTASIYVRAQSGTVNVGLRGADSADGITYSMRSFVNAEITSTSWTRISTTFSPNSSFAALQITSLSAIFLDAVLIEETPLLDAYFDGSNDPVYNSTDPDAPDYQPERAFETYDTSWSI